MPFLYKLVLFVVVSVGFGWLTRSSLRDIRSHGFYRFFAVVAIVASILLNIDYWFDEPLSAHQIISWILLTVGTYLVVHGALLLLKSGKPDHARTDAALLGIEKTTRLVTTGIYRYIRHPLYSSLLFLAWGVFFKRPSIVGGGLAVAATIFLATTARIEEAENVRFFGASYEAYMKQTKMFVPFVF